MPCGNNSAGHFYFCSIESGEPTGVAMIAWLSGSCYRRRFAASLHSQQKFSGCIDNSSKSGIIYLYCIKGAKLWQNTHRVRKPVRLNLLFILNQLLIFFQKYFPSNRHCLCKGKYLKMGGSDRSHCHPNYLLCGLNGREISPAGSHASG